MKVVVLGGDGFCGWPTALKLAKEGHTVSIVDNLSRRDIDEQLNSYSLTNISSMQERIDAARIHGLNISFANIDIALDYEVFKTYISIIKPVAIVHFAEQRAAPYSMISDKERRYTVDNNISTTHNVLNAIVEVDKDIHLVHLGTMGVYGYSKDFGDIPEGYLNVKINSTDKDVDILYPTNPGSVYHMTKSIDQLLFQFYNKNWNLKITDLHQGIVWGAQTKETSLDPKLVNRFDYDGIYGTVLNRFLVQASNKHDLTVYGTGGQKRAFIHIEDTAKCVILAVETPPVDTSKVRIFNQVSEVRSVRELAEMLKSKISYINNPRKELAENDLSVSNEGLKSLGFKPTTLSDELLNDVKFLSAKNAGNFNKDNVLTSPEW
tara:strand:+ start:1133 stop:2266 length:1134 start_codon:yes stop_codon:yes gene_type:complete